MKELIEALQILAKYANPTYPFHCEHDVLYVDINPELVSDEDKKRLKSMGFFDGSTGKNGSEYENGFYSFKYGSC